MRNSAISKVEENRKVILKWTSRKELTLNDVLHVSDIRENLISDSILNKKDFKMVFEFGKFLLTKNDMYMGKSYLVDGLFKTNVAIVDEKSMYMYLNSLIKGVLLFICLSLLYCGILY